MAALLAPSNAATQGWHCFGETCYASPPLLASHVGCASACSSYAHSTRRDGATAGLAFVATQETTEFLVRHVLKGHRHWIGLYHALEGMHMAVGTAELGTWKWAASRGAADTPTAWANWAPSQPDAGLGREDCVGIDGSGRWHDLGCGRAEYRCLCELHAQTRPSYFEESAQLLAVAEAEAWATATFALKAFVALFVPIVLLVLLSSHRLNQQLQQCGKQREAQLYLTLSPYPPF